MRASTPLTTHFITIYCVRGTARHRAHCLYEPVTSQSLLGQQGSQLSGWRSALNNPPYGADKHAGIWSPSICEIENNWMKIWMHNHIQRQSVWLISQSLAVTHLNCACSLIVSWAHASLVKKTTSPSMADEKNNSPPHLLRSGCHLRVGLYTMYWQLGIGNCRIFFILFKILMRETYTCFLMIVFTFDSSNSTAMRSYIKWVYG